MRTFTTLFLAGSAAAVLAAAAAMAADNTTHTHLMTVQLPGGGVEQIRYTGDVAPQVAFEPNAAPLGPVAAPMTPTDANSPFALLNRIQAEMDREIAALMRNGAPMAPPHAVGSGPVQQADLAKDPPGAESYSSISTFSGGHVCSRSVQVTSQGPGHPPRVVSSSSGDCGGASAAGVTSGSAREADSIAPGAI